MVAAQSKRPGEGTDAESLNIFEHQQHGNHGGGERDVVQEGGGDTADLVGEKLRESENLSWLCLSTGWEMEAVL